VVAEALARFGYDFSKAVIPSTEQERQRANDSRKLAIDTFTGN